MQFEERRTRVLSVRLHDDEFEYLKKASKLLGLPSVSEFARTAVFDYAGKLAHSPEESRRRTNLVRLQLRIDSLEKELRRLKKEL